MRSGHTVYLIARIALFLAILELWAKGAGLDTGVDAITAVERIDIAGNKPAFGTWLRIRGALDPATSPKRKIAQYRGALQQLRRDGFPVCVLVQTDENQATAGSAVPEASGRIPRLFQWMCRLNSTYGGAVDAWEFGDEPDLRFDLPPSTYVSMLRTCAIAVNDSGSVGHKPLVIMAGLGLPPGHWLLGFLANGGMLVTDAFNFHYYGYREDVAAAIAQVEHVVGSELPLFATEYGYGALTAPAAHSSAGRERQKTWFESASATFLQRNVQAFAFVAKPYIEDGLEFGLFSETHKGGAWKPSPAYEVLRRAGHAGLRAPVNHPERPQVVLDVEFDPKFLEKLGLRKIPVFQEGQLRGTLKIYNFAAAALVGQVRWLDPASSKTLGDTAVHIEPRRTLSIPVTINAGSENHLFRDIAFELHDGSAHLLDRRVIEVSFARRRDIVDGVLSFNDSLAKCRSERIQESLLADEESALEKSGRWLATPGVTVLESNQSWLFNVAGMPPQPDQPARIELPLPPTLRISEDSVLRMWVRRKSEAEGDTNIRIGFRDQRGQLYGMWPAFRVRSGTSRLDLYVHEMNPSFYCRPSVPVSPTIRSPESLVFTIRPAHLPETVEVLNAVLLDERP